MYLSNNDEDKTEIPTEQKNLDIENNNTILSPRANNTVRPRLERSVRNPNLLLASLRARTEENNSELANIIPERKLDVNNLQSSPTILRGNNHQTNIDSANILPMEQFSANNIQNDAEELPKSYKY